MRFLLNANLLMAMLMALTLGVLGTCGANVQAAEEDSELNQALAVIRAVGPKGEGNGPASKAAQTVAKAKGDQLTTILAAMDGTGVLAENWLRGAAEAVADQT